jgi:RimJ/RimL family protein N-acetyltransferase
MRLAEIAYLKYRLGSNEAFVSSQVCLKPLNTSLNDSNASADRVSFEIGDRRSIEPIGTGQLLNIDGNHRKAELEVTIRRATSQGAWLEAETSRLLVNFGFKELGLDRIFFHVPAANHDAIAIYERLGFKEQEVRERAKTIDGKSANSIVMFKLRTDV